MSPRIGMHLSLVKKRLRQISRLVILGYTLTSCGTSVRSSHLPQRSQPGAVIPADTSHESPARTDDLKVGRVADREEQSNAKSPLPPSTGDIDVGRPIKHQGDKLSLSLIDPPGWGDRNNAMKQPEEVTHVEIELSPNSAQFIPVQPISCGTAEASQGLLTVRHEEVFPNWDRTVYGSLPEPQAIDFSGALFQRLPFKYGQKINIYGVPKGVYQVKVKLLDSNMATVFKGQSFATFLVDQTASNGIYLCEIRRWIYMDEYGVVKERAQ